MITDIRETSLILMTLDGLKNKLINEQACCNIYRIYKLHLFC